MNQFICDRATYHDRLPIPVSVVLPPFSNFKSHSEVTNLNKIPNMTLGLSFYDFSSPNLSEIEFTQWRSSAATCNHSWITHPNFSRPTELHSLGVSNPSPLKTCPRWPPHAVQVISVRVIPYDSSSCLVTAPGIAVRYASLNDRKQARMKERTIEERRPSTSTLHWSERFRNQLIDIEVREFKMDGYIKLGGTLIQRCPTSSAWIDTVLLMFVVLPTPCRFCTLLAEDPELQSPGCDQL